MRKFRNEFNRAEIITLEELEKNPKYQKAVEENYKDEALFDDWLYCQQYTLLEVWNLSEADKIEIKKGYLCNCKEMAITDLDYEEIFD